MKIGILGLLSLVLIILKALGLVPISWVVAFIPLMISVFIGVVAFIVGVIMFGIIVGNTDDIQ